MKNTFMIKVFANIIFQFIVNKTMFYSQTNV